MQANTFLLYGAYGYTGELIARYAAQYNLYPILAGRREAALQPLATRLNLPYKVVDLDDTPTLLAALREVNVVVHAAGPYDYTAKQMVAACLQTGTHYLDLNGDLAIYEMLHRYDAAAKQANVMLLPGAGFDVVPTDCLALFLQQRLPDAVNLELAFTILGSTLSHGTAVNSVLKMGEPSAIRKNGAIVQEPLGKKGKWIDFGVKKLFVMSLPWGDIASAYYTTGIPNIRSYTTVPKAAYWLLKFQFLFNGLLRTNWLRNFVKKQVARRPPGPNDEMRRKSISIIWGQATNANGQTVTARLRTPEAYDLTAYAVLHITRKILEGQYSTGYQTPAGAYGPDLVMELPAVQREVL